MTTHLRPMERCVQRLAADGHDEVEIAWRLRRTPRYVRQVRELSERSGRDGRDSRDADGLRPIERRVLRWREDGATHDDLAPRFRRGPRFLEQVERLANYKLGA